MLCVHNFSLVLRFYIYYLYTMSSGKKAWYNEAISLSITRFVPNLVKKWKGEKGQLYCHTGHEGVASTRFSRLIKLLMQIGRDMAGSGLALLCRTISNGLCRNFRQVLCDPKMSRDWPQTKTSSPQRKLRQWQYSCTVVPLSPPVSHLDFIQRPNSSACSHIF